MNTKMQKASIIAFDLINTSRLKFEDLQCYEKITDNTIDQGRPSSFDKECRQIGVNPSLFVWCYTRTAGSLPIAKSEIKRVVYEYKIEKLF